MDNTKTTTIVCSTYRVVLDDNAFKYRVYYYLIILSQNYTKKVFVTLGILDLIDTDRRDRAQLPVLDPPLHDILDRLSMAARFRR